MRLLVSEPRNPDEVPAARRLASLEPATVLAAVARYYGVVPDCFQERRSGQLARDVAAWLARRRSSATLRVLAPEFGLSHPDSVNNLVRRVDRALAESRKLRHDIEMIERILESPKTENRAFYEFAEVKPPPSTFFFRFCSSSLGAPSTCRSHLRVPRLAVRGEAGNPEVIVPCIPRYLRVLMRPPGLCSGFRAFGLVASSGVRPHRVGTTFYPS